MKTGLLLAPGTASAGAAGSADMTDSGCLFLGAGSESVTYSLPRANSLRFGMMWATYPAELRAPQSMERIAYHEAGHVVMMELLGMRSLSAVVSSETGSKAHGKPTPPEDPIDDARTPNEAAAVCAAIYHAGTMAEMLLMRSKWVGPIFYPWASDYLEAEERFLRPVLGAHCSGGHAYAQRVALHVLSKAWWRVREIAGHLIEHGEWSESSVIKQLENHSIRRS